MTTLWHDIRHGLRQMRKSPGFTSVAVVSLAIGIGLNATVFTALNAVFLRPLPFSNDHEIVRITWPYSVSYPDYLELKEQSRTLSGIIAVSHDGGGAMLNREGRTELLSSSVVSPNYFQVLGIKPHVGRFFSPESQSSVHEPTVVISYSLWQRCYEGDPQICGKTIWLDARSHTILGVTPKKFSGVFRQRSVDVWFPVRNDLGRSSSCSLLGRLAPGVGVEAAVAEVDAIVNRLGIDLTAPNTGRSLKVRVEAERDLWKRNGILVSMVMSVAVLVLLVACANVSALLLARNESRQHEIAVRRAIGSSRLRLLRQLLTESLLLSFLGTVLAVLLARWAASLLPALLPDIGFLKVPELRLDRQVLTMIFMLMGLATLSFGFVPALRVTRIDPATHIKGSRNSSGGKRRYFGRNALVIGQLAVSLIFLATTGLFIGQFAKGLSMDFGFQNKEMLLIKLAPGVFGVNGNQGQAYYTQLIEQVKAVPTVKQVSLASFVPFSLFGGGATKQVYVPGDSTDVSQQGSEWRYSIIHPDYFKTMGIPVRQGRVFNERECTSDAKVAMISETAARRFWADRDPVGESLFIGGAQGKAYQIVGIVRDVRITDLTTPLEPYLYLPFGQEDRGEMTLLVETQGKAELAVEPIRRVMETVNRNVLPLFVTTLKQQVHFVLLPQWIASWLLGVLGGSAFIMAIAGLYSLVSYSVARRTHEIGVRMAVGASSRDILIAVLRQGLTLAVIGVCLGLPVVLGVGNILRSEMFGLDAADPIVLVGTSLLVVAVAVLAAWIPGRRAAKVDPMVALRYE
ncbi:MAG: ABC transporter permease [Solirubrobacterales bacterium]